MGRLPNWNPHPRLGAVSATPSHQADPSPSSLTHGKVQLVEVLQRSSPVFPAKVTARVGSCGSLRSLGFCELGILEFEFTAQLVKLLPFNVEHADLFHRSLACQSVAKRRLGQVRSSKKRGMGPGPSALPEGSALQEVGGADTAMMDGRAAQERQAGLKMAWKQETAEGCRACSICLLRAILLMA